MCVLNCFKMLNYSSGGLSFKGEKVLKYFIWEKLNEICV